MDAGCMPVCALSNTERDTEKTMHPRRSEQPNASLANAPGTHGRQQDWAPKAHWRNASQLCAGMIRVGRCDFFLCAQSHSQAQASCPNLKKPGAIASKTNGYPD
jgi:hypothetical protein